MSTSSRTAIALSAGRRFAAAALIKAVTSPGAAAVLKAKDMELAL